MSDLPTPTGNNPTDTTNPVPVVSTGIGGKEKESGVASAEPALRQVGQEMEVSSELTSAGVKVHPTSIPIPSPISKMGVQATGQNVSAGVPAIALPLTDDQIAQGLKQGVASSWRWLAEWCVRKLKQVHMGLKSIHGNLVRVRE